MSRESAKLLRDPLLRKLLSQTLVQAYGGHKGVVDEDDWAWVARIDRAAGDSTGFASSHCSKYFAKRRARRSHADPPEHKPKTAVTDHRFLKLRLILDCDCHLILTIHRSQGPRPDVDELLPLMRHMDGHVWPEQMLLDAGYDSEANHVLLRETQEMESIIPPKIGRPTDKLPTGQLPRAAASWPPTSTTRPTACACRPRPSCPCSNET